MNPIQLIKFKLYFIWLFSSLTNLKNNVHGCDTELCGGLMIRCILLKSCECDVKENLMCFKKCSKCLDYLYLECCSCFDVCTEQSYFTDNQTNLPQEKVNYFFTQLLNRRRRNDWDHHLDVNIYSKVCELNSVKIRFKDFGWDEWIIAPEGFTFYSCQGSCAFPLKNSMNATNHAILQSLMHLQNPDSIPKAICVSTKLSPISFIVLDESLNVVWKKYDRMNAESCGCH